MQLKLLDFQTKSFDDEFIINMFGMNEKGESFCIEISDYKPCFYCRVPDWYTKHDKQLFLDHIKSKVGPYMSEFIVDCSLINRRKFDGFDGLREYKFICLKFKGLSCFHRVKNMWYHEIQSNKPSKFNKKPGFAWVLKKEGYNFKGHYIQLYESNIPPLLRYFHIKNISPSGWIEISNYTEISPKNTTCTYEFNVSAKDIEPIAKETIVPYVIASFDIEANSSHGDFPLPVKDYKKLAQQIVDCFQTVEKKDTLPTLQKCIHSAFGFETMHEIDIVYTKRQITIDQADTMFQKWIKQPLRNYVPTETVELHTDLDHGGEDDSDNEAEVAKRIKEYDQESTVIEMLQDKEFDKDSKINELQKGLNSIFPKIKGDQVTYIGTTFVRYGESKPYLNHCIVLGTCSPVDNVVLECYPTEAEVLVAWKNLIQRENPNILIGYNTFGFDYKFMFHRAIETDCIEEFLQLSCTNETCGKYENDVWKIEENTVFLASGEYNLNYIKMPGRLQIDLYTEFRRNYNLSSYTLNNVSAEFIGDSVPKLEHDETNNVTQIFSKNLQGLEQFNYVMFEEVSHSSDYYKNGKKFKVMEIGKGYFTVEGLIMPDLRKNVRWCLAKDDVDHHDIFNFYKGSDDDRAIIAKYCIQDCNLVHRLFQKIDLLTELVEMASICSVPVEFIVMRGQGIKTASLIAKKCRENNILMPVLEKPEFSEGYEGAVVLPPKCGFYFEEPVYVNDYNSLYPSTIIAGNMSMDSLQSVKMYDLQDNLIEEIGVKKHGVYVYDNLPGFTYEDVASDTYKYVRKTPKSAAVKVKSGYMVCRFAHFPNDKKAIIPYVLEMLLKSRKDTKKLMEKESDPFMKQIYNKRQNALKITANSIYGQCGAPTSMFYNKYVAASCTAGGRQLLNFAKELIENVYDNRECDTSFGKVMVKSEYIYGDTDSVFYKLQITKDGRKLLGKESLAIGMELAVESGDLATSMLRAPHKLAFEKAIWPFVLFKKKRYIGDYYEENTEDCYRKNMGNVLKRRDNCDLLKDSYGGTIDILMQEQNIPKAIAFAKNYMTRLVNGEIPIEKLIITKSLRSGYKNPNSIAHNVLANRIGRRDPGNKPKPGNRMKYLFIKTKPVKGVKELQGDKIETPEFVREHKLAPDYKYYITNQMMKPLQQVFALVLDKIPGFNRQKYEADLEQYKDLDPDAFEKKETLLKNKEIKQLIFSEFI